MITLNSVCMYGSRICKVVDIRDELFGNFKKEYYVLSPIYDNKNTIYVPKDNPLLISKMRDILTVAQIDDLISQVNNLSVIWFEDAKQRPLKCREIFETGDRLKIILVIKGFVEHKKRLLRVGRNFPSSDEAILQKAQKAIYQEFAYVLGIEPDEVKEYLKTKNASF